MKSSERIQVKPEGAMSEDEFVEEEAEYEEMGNHFDVIKHIGDYNPDAAAVEIGTPKFVPRVPIPVSDGRIRLPPPPKKPHLQRTDVPSSTTPVIPRPPTPTEKPFSWKEYRKTHPDARKYSDRKEYLRDYQRGYMRRRRARQKELLGSGE